MMKQLRSGLENTITCRRGLGFHRQKYTE
jgi:hypothetical protein